MSSLNSPEYQEKQSQVMDKYFIFCAFSSKQIKEGLQESQYKGSSKYCAIGHGYYCPKEHISDFIAGLEAIHQEEVKTLKAKRQADPQEKERQILSELCNYECFYTGDPTDAIEALEAYGITEQEVRNVFKDKWGEYA